MVSARFGVSVDQLIAANDVADPDRLLAGLAMVITAPAAVRELRSRRRRNRSTAVIVPRSQRQHCVRHDVLMAISWGDAVADLDNPEDMSWYDRAVAQARELDGLMRSFMRAVRRACKWPMSTAGEYDPTLVPDTLETSSTGPRLRASADGSWIIRGEPPLSIVVRVRPRGEPSFGSGGRSSVIASRDFDAQMKAMEDTKNWSPRALVAWLRREEIEIPSDQ